MATNPNNLTPKMKQLIAKVKAGELNEEQLRSRWADIESSYTNSSTSSSSSGPSIGSYGSSSWHGVVDLRPNDSSSSSPSASSSSSSAPETRRSSDSDDDKSGEEKNTPSAASLAGSMSSHSGPFKSSQAAPEPTPTLREISQWTRTTFQGSNK